ncbi:hypothetical protein ES708_15541 [subsurface metagenome]
MDTIISVVLREYLLKFNLVITPLNATSSHIPGINMVIKKNHPRNAILEPGVPKITSKSNI